MQESDYSHLLNYPMPTLLFQKHRCKDGLQYIYQVTLLFQCIIKLVTKLN
jgi:hypothetical protein